MPPTDTTPEPAFFNGQCNTAKSSRACQQATAWSPLTEESPILLVEPKTESAATLQSALERGTGWRVLLAESANDALTAASILRSRLKVVLITAGRHYDPILKLIRDLKELAMVNRTEAPHMLVLSLISQNPEGALSFERLGAEYLLRAYSEHILETVKKVQWRLRTAGCSLPIIVIRRRGGYVTEVLVRNGFVRTDLRLGPRLRELLEFLALHSRTEQTTQMIADAMGICRQSVKQYLRLLRRAYDDACKGEPVGLTGAEVFWTKRIAGGYVHGVNARFEITDDIEF